MAGEYPTQQDNDISLLKKIVSNTAQSIAQMQIGIIVGEVQVYALLPVTIDDPALYSAYLVKESTGIWPINLHPAGIYIRTANNGDLNDWS